MDRIDREIIAALAADARRSLQDVAVHVRLSASATRDRLRRLERQGPIIGYTALLDSAALGFPVHAAAEVDMAPGTDPIAFEEGLRGLPPVVEALHATGDCDYLVRLHCRDTAELHHVVRAIKEQLGALRTMTRVVLDTPVAARPRLPASHA
jgi:Lrp/AsnC family transcriptional regulator, leucine-responsive regulatory protein